VRGDPAAAREGGRVRGLGGGPRQCSRT
jgi:hypothetical protein